MVAGLAGGLPGDARAATEYQIKAGFLYNLAKFIEWPAPAFEKPQTPYSVCVLGPDPFGELLDVVVGEGTLHGRRMVVRRLTEIKNVTGCHILFVSRLDPKKLPALFQAVAGSPTLTVGETEDFIRAGGCLRFFTTQENKESMVRFEINLQATERAQLKVSAKLLTLARVVGKPPGKY